MDARSPSRIAVDAMGGDHGPAVVVPGALSAARQVAGRARIVLIGDQPRVEAALASCGARPGDVELVHAPQNIDMCEAPATAIRRKPDSSIVVGCQMMKDGKVDAFVSAGSTGAVVAGALLLVGRLPGVARPGIASVFPTRRGTGLLIDVGANSDCKPLHLLQYAAMGRIYAQSVLGKSLPRVGLLNIGEEPSKGNELSQEAHKLLAEHTPGFIGNLEGRDLFEGAADVVVTDGFVGNVVLKMIEGFVPFWEEGIHGASRKDFTSRAGLWFLRRALRRWRRRFDYAEYGGAPLLGCQRVTVICHGSSSTHAVSNGVHVALRAVRDRIDERIHEELEREGALAPAESPPRPAREGAPS